MMNPLILCGKTWQSPNPRAQMLLCPVNQSAPALLAKRVNEPSCDGLGKHLVAGVEPLRGHDPQGELTRVQRPAGERLLA